MRALLWTLLGGCTAAAVDETGGQNLGGQAGEDTALVACEEPIDATHAADAVTPLGETVEALATAAEGTRELAVAWTAGGTASLRLTIDYEGGEARWTNATTCEERLEIEVIAAGEGAIAFTGRGLLTLTPNEGLLYVGLAPDAVSGWDVPRTAARVEIDLDVRAWTGELRVVHADGVVEQVAAVVPGG